MSSFFTLSLVCLFCFVISTQQAHYPRQNWRLAALRNQLLQFDEGPHFCRCKFKWSVSAPREAARTTSRGKILAAAETLATHLYIC